MRVTAGFVWGLSSTVFISAFVLGRRLRLSSDRLSPPRGAKLGASAIRYWRRECPDQLARRLSLRPAVGLNRPSRRREFAQRKPVVPPRLPPAGCLARSAPDPSLFLNYAGAMSGSGHYTDSRYWRALGTISPVGTLGTAFPRRSPGLHRFIRLVWLKSRQVVCDAFHVCGLAASYFG